MCIEPASSWQVEIRPRTSGNFRARTDFPSYLVQPPNHANALGAWRVRATKITPARRAWRATGRVLTATARRQRQMAGMSKMATSGHRESFNPLVRKIFEILQVHGARCFCELSPG